MSNIVNQRIRSEKYHWARCEMDQYDYIVKGLNNEYLYIELTGKKSNITGLRKPQFIRLLDNISLQESMLRDPELTSYEWDNYYEEKIVPVLDGVMDELESCKLIKLTPKDKENYLLNDIVYGECKQFILGLFNEAQELHQTATPNDWFWNIVPDEMKEKVLL